MKNRFFIWLVAMGFASVSLSCEVFNCGEKEDTIDTVVEDAAMRMLSQIEEGQEFDVTNMARLLYGATGYWRADAELEYNDADYSKAKQINRAFNTPFWVEDYEPVLRFVNGSSIYRYTIRPSDGVMVEQSGECSFDPRTSELAVNIAEHDNFGAVASKFVVKALCDKALVLDWTSESGKYIRTLYTPISFADMCSVEATLRVSNKLAEIVNFDSSAVSNEIVGSWMVDTSIKYDASWSTVESVDELFGNSYDVAGKIFQLFTFNQDGTIKVYTEPEDPNIEPTERSYSWQYDAENKSIKVNLSETVVKEYRLVGFGTDYMFVDYYDSINDRYMRAGLTRRE